MIEELTEFLQRKHYTPERADAIQERYYKYIKGKCDMMVHWRVAKDIEEWQREVGEIDESEH